MTVTTINTDIKDFQNIYIAVHFNLIKAGTNVSKM